MNQQLTGMDNQVGSPIDLAQQVAKIKVANHGCKDEGNYDGVMSVSQLSVSCVSGNEGSGKVK